MVFRFLYAIKTYKMQIKTYDYEKIKFTQKL